MTYRVVTHGSNGEIMTRDYESEQELLLLHTQIGIEDCSTDLNLRGKPVFRGLIGPIPEGNCIARYESPDVFEMLTKEWSAPRRKRHPKKVG